MKLIRHAVQGKGTNWQVQTDNGLFVADFGWHDESEKNARDYVNSHEAAEELAKKAKEVERVVLTQPSTYSTIRAAVIDLAAALAKFRKESANA